MLPNIRAKFLSPPLTLLNIHRPLLTNVEAVRLSGLLGNVVNVAYPPLPVRALSPHYVAFVSFKLTQIALPLTVLALSPNGIGALGNIDVPVVNEVTTTVSVATAPPTAIALRSS